jgi:hypothetical protein
LEAGGRWRAFTEAGQGYDTAPLQDASSAPSPWRWQAADAGWTGRWSRDLRGHAGVNALAQQYGNANSQEAQSYGLDLGLEQRAWDALRLSVDAAAEDWIAPLQPSLSAFHWTAAPGLGWDLAAGWRLRTRALGDGWAYPDGDLDSTALGGDLLLEGELSPGCVLSLDGRRDQRRFSERYLWSASGFKASDRLRVDEELSLGAGMSLEAAGAQWRLRYQLERRQSNANAFDFGPFQSMYSDFSANSPAVFANNTLLQGAESELDHRLDVGVGAGPTDWARVDLSGALGLRAFDSRLAKDAQDRLLTDVRRDSLWEAGLRLRLGPWSGCELDLGFEHLQSASNDWLFTYARDRSEAALRWEL